MEPTTDQQKSLNQYVGTRAEVEMREDGIMVITQGTGSGRDQIAVAPDGTPTDLPCGDCGDPDVYTEYEWHTDAWLCSRCRDERAEDAEADAAYDRAGDR